jgi:transcription termination/antitermination protein NusG
MRNISADSFVSASARPPSQAGSRLAAPLRVAFSHRKSSCDRLCNSAEKARCQTAGRDDLPKHRSRSMRSKPGTPPGGLDPKFATSRMVGCILGVDPISYRWLRIRVLAFANIAGRITIISMAAACSMSTIHKDAFSSLDGDWIAVYVKTGWEHSVSNQLRDFGYEHYLPVRTSGDRLARGERRNVPLFPGYVFCRFRSVAEIRIVRASGVLRLVGYGGQPAPIPDPEIAAIRRVLDSGLDSEPWNLLKAGQLVRVEDGPLRGIEGTLLAVKSSSRLVVGIKMLQRFVAVNIAGWEVVPLRTGERGKAH